jgi:hypothetical protein
VGERPQGYAVVAPPSPRFLSPLSSHHMAPPSPFTLIKVAFAAADSGGSTPAFDARLVASSCYNPSTREWISYDSPESAAAP